MTEDLKQHLPARIDYSPPETRLLELTSELPGLIKKVEELEVIDRNKTKVADAIGYEPRFVLEASSVRLRIESLFSTPTLDTPPTNFFTNFKIVINDSERKPDKPSSVKSLIRRLAQILHDDAQDPFIKIIFSEDERTLLFSQLIRAADNNDTKQVQKLFLRIIPRYYQVLIDSCQSQGLSFSQILKMYPDILDDLETARYLIYTQTAEQKNETKNSQILEDEKATDTVINALINQKNRWAWYNGFFLLSDALRIIAGNIQGFYLPPEVDKGFNDVLRRMEAIGMLLAFSTSYEEINNTPSDSSDSFPYSDIRRIIEDRLKILPMCVLNLAKAIKIRPEEIRDIVLNFSNKLEEIYFLLRDYYKTVKSTHPSLFEIYALQNQLSIVLNKILGEKEEKILPNGIRLTKRKKSKSEEPEIGDNRIQWFEYEYFPEDYVSHHYDYIFVNGRWWVRYSRSIAWHSSIGGIFFSGTVEDYYNYFNFKIFPSLKEPPKASNELEKKALEYGFSPASPEMIKIALEKISASSK